MKESILLVEDEKSISEIVVFNLIQEGFEVALASNGFEAIEIVKKTPNGFSLIILDLMIPVISGWDVCDAVKKINSSTPVMMVTARSGTEDRIRGLRMGADDYLVKPFDLEELLLRVRNLIRRSGKEKFQEELKFGGNYVNEVTWEAVNFKGEKLQLTKREINLLNLLFTRKNEVISRDEILERIWDASENPSARTIDNMVLNFRKFFELDSKNPVHFI